MTAGDPGDLKHVILGFCLDEAYDLWEVLNEVEKDRFASGARRLSRKELMDLATPAASDLVKSGLLRIAVREGLQPETPLAAAAALAVLAVHESWIQPAGLTARGWSAATTLAGREAFQSKKFLA